MAYTLIGSLKTRTLRVAWLLAEMELEYKHISAPPRSDEVTKHSAAGKIPVLLADGVALTDSVAIMSFLGDKHEQFTAPAGSVERGLQDGHTQFICDEIDAVLWTAAKHSFVLPEEHRVSAVKDSLRWELARGWKRLEARLGDKPYLMGDAPTIPDFLAAHCAGWARSAKFPEPSAVLVDHLKRMRARPAFGKLVG